MCSSTAAASSHFGVLWATDLLWLPAFHILPSPTVCHITHALARRTKLYINSFNLERKRFFKFSVSLFRKSTALVYSIMQNFPDYAESDDTPQVQVGEEEQHLPQPLTHTSGRRAPTSPPPPPLTPQYSHPSSATGPDFLHLIKFLEETRLQ